MRDSKVEVNGHIFQKKELITIRSAVVIRIVDLKKNINKPDATLTRRSFLRDELRKIDGLEKKLDELIWDFNLPM